MIDINDTLIPLENVLYARVDTRVSAAGSNWQIKIYLKGGVETGWIYSCGIDGQRNALADLDTIRRQMKGAEADG